MENENITITITGKDTLLVLSEIASRFDMEREEMLKTMFEKLTEAYISNPTRFNAMMNMLLKLFSKQMKNIEKEGAK